MNDGYRSNTTLQPTGAYQYAMEGKEGLMMCTVQSTPMEIRYCRFGDIQDIASKSTISMCVRSLSLLLTLRLVRLGAVPPWVPHAVGTKGNKHEITAHKPIAKPWIDWWS